LVALLSGRTKRPGGTRRDHNYSWVIRNHFLTNYLIFFDGRHVELASLGNPKQSGGPGVLFVYGDMAVSIYNAADSRQFIADCTMAGGVRSMGFRAGSRLPGVPGPPGLSANGAAFLGS
jgi:hypothetical protein